MKACPKNLHTLRKRRGVERMATWQHPAHSSATSSNGASSDKTSSTRPHVMSCSQPCSPSTASLVPGSQSKPQSISKRCGSLHSQSCLFPHLTAPLNSVLGANTETYLNLCSVSNPVPDKQWDHQKGFLSFIQMVNLVDQEPSGHERSKTYIKLNN